MASKAESSLRVSMLANPQNKQETFRPVGDGMSSLNYDRDARTALRPTNAGGMELAGLLRLDAF